jgi:hypothetical protein
MKYSFLLLFLFVGCITSPIAAQQELFLASQQNHVYNSLTNPAAWPKDKRWYIGLPGIALDANHSGSITFNDFIQKDGGKRILNMDQLIDKLDAQNTIHVDQRTETFSLGVKATKHLGLHMYHAIRTTADIAYPKNALQLLWQGNAQFIGESVQIDPRLSLGAYNEFGLGGNWQTDKWSVGGRLKYYSGIAMVETKRFEASVFTDPDIYQLTLGSDIQIVSAGAIKSIDTTSNGFDVQLLEFDRKQLISKNNGFGVDLGASFKVSEKLTVSASALDLGASINWKDDTKQFESKGTYNYAGVFFDGNTFLDDQGQINVDTQLDSLREAFQFTTTNTTSKQKLPARFYASANYQMNDRVDFGFAASTSKNYFSESLYGLGVSVGYKPVKWLKIGTMLSTSDHNAVQLGSLITASLGPVQMYLISDDVLSAFTPKARPSVQLRYGFALLF